MSMKSIKCTYVRTRYESSDFVVNLYRDTESNKELVATGVLLPNQTGVTVELIGEWVKSKYGPQFKASAYNILEPTTEAGLIAYLGSGLIKGIGPKTAERIVASFGTESLEVFKKAPERLLLVKGVTQRRLATMVNNFRQSQYIQELVSLLGQFGIGLGKAKKIYDMYGEKSVTTIKDRPFSMCSVPGFGFKTVDTISQTLGASTHSADRLTEALRYVLEQNECNGHMFMEQKNLLEQTLELLNEKSTGADTVSRAELQDVAEVETFRGTFSIRTGPKGEIYVYTARSYRAETTLASDIVALLARPTPKMDESYLQKAITGWCKKASLEEGKEISLAPEQSQAVAMALNNRISIVTGGPGTGKSMILRAMVEIYEQCQPPVKSGETEHVVTLMAPTGRAARRMNESTGKPASTIHKALHLTPDNADIGDSGFVLASGIVIIDEFSMVDAYLAANLFRRLPEDIQLVLVGDADQLPSVGAGNVLREMMASGVIPTTTLSRIFRQAEASSIVLNAHAINSGSTKLKADSQFALLITDDADTAAETVIDRYLSEVKRIGVENVVVLAPFRKRGILCSDALNLRIRDLVNPRGEGDLTIAVNGCEYRKGDRIMQLKNSAEVSNGDIGTIIEITAPKEPDLDDDDALPQGPTATIRFESGAELTYGSEQLAETTLAYVMTIHKSQGAQYKTVILILMKSHFVMLRRNLLYTAVTRARDKVILVGERAAIAMAIKKSDVDQRNSMLAALISNRPVNA